MIVTDTYESDTTWYRPCPINLDAARSVAATVRNAAYPALDGALADTIAAICTWAQVPPAVGCLIHTGQLGWHTDRRSPPGVWNITVWMRDPDSTGGHLLLPDDDLELAAANGWAAHFNGQHRPHRVTDWTGWRASMTLWCPRA